METSNQPSVLGTPVNTTSNAATATAPATSTAAKPAPEKTEAPKLPTSNYAWPFKPTHADLAEGAAIAILDQLLREEAKGQSGVLYLSDMATGDANSLALSKLTSRMYSNEGGNILDMVTVADLKAIEKKNLKLPEPTLKAKVKAWFDKKEVLPDDQIIGYRVSEKGKQKIKDQNRCYWDELRGFYDFYKYVNVNGNTPQERFVLHPDNVKAVMFIANGEARIEPSAVHLSLLPEFLRPYFQNTDGTAKVLTGAEGFEILKTEVKSDDLRIFVMLMKGINPWKVVFLQNRAEGMFQELDIRTDAVNFVTDINWQDTVDSINQQISPQFYLDQGIPQEKVVEFFQALASEAPEAYLGFGKVFAQYNDSVAAYNGQVNEYNSKLAEYEQALRDAERNQYVQDEYVEEYVEETIVTPVSVQTAYVYGSAFDPFYVSPIWVEPVVIWDPWDDYYPVVVPTRVVVL